MTRNTTSLFAGVFKPVYFFPTNIIPLPPYWIFGDLWIVGLFHSILMVIYDKIEEANECLLVGDVEVSCWHAELR